MAWEIVEDPFGQGALEEVPLSQSPLKVALFQASFGQPVTGFSIPNNIDRLKVALESEFPYANTQRQQNFQVSITPGASFQGPQEIQVHTFMDATQRWVLTVAPDSVSLMTTQYKSRDDLVARSSHALQAVEGITSAPHLVRLGVRYINRIEGAELVETVLSKANPDVSSVRTVVRGSSGELQHLMTDLAFAPPSIEDGLSRRIQCRWGQLPQGVVHDGLLEPISAPSWILDIDSVAEGNQQFRAVDISDEVRRLSERSYQVFRWVMTNEALKELGA